MELESPSTEERRSISEFRMKHSGQDIWVVASASSMDHVAPEFFANKLVIGVNDVYRRYPCNYLVRKEASGANEARAAGIPLIISEFDCGNRTSGRNHVDGVAWYYDHLHNECSRMDLSVVGTEKIVVSFSTITSAMHVAAYMGAANIIVCGHDGGALDGRMTYTGYYPEDPGYTAWYRDWVSQIMWQSRAVRDRLQEVYGCRIHTLNPFIGFDLEGHRFSTSPEDGESTSPLSTYHAYWCNPPAQNQPAAYVDGEQRSAVIVDCLKQYCPDSETTILELGCNVGRNLWHLQCAGYRRLSGVDLNRDALNLSSSAFPELKAQLTCDFIETFVDRQVSPFDVIFTLSVLNHLPPACDASFSQFARLATRWLVTLEDERSASSRHVPRDYRRVFESLGFEHLHSRPFADGDSTGLDSNFLLRVFRAKRR